jgi:hypothetical protein
MNASAGSVELLTAPATPAAQQWQGWGTALKPAFEPIVVARKPLIGTVAENVLAHGTGGLNIDGCRIGTTDNLKLSAASVWRRGGNGATRNHDKRWQLVQAAGLPTSSLTSHRPPSWTGRVGIDRVP